MTTMKRFTTAFAMLAFAAAPVASQQTQMGMPHQRGGMMDPGAMQMCHAMMGSGGGMSGHAMMGGSDAMMGMMQGMRLTPAAHQKASEALTGDTPDLQAYERGLQEAAGHMVQAQVAMTRGSLDARAA